MPRPSQTPEAHREERVSGCAPTAGCPTLRAMAKTTRPATRTQKARAHEPTVAGPTFESEHLERLADEGAAAWTKILRDRRDPHRRHAGEARPASSILEVMGWELQTAPVGLRRRTRPGLGCRRNRARHSVVFSVIATSAPSTAVWQRLRKNWANQSGIANASRRVIAGSSAQRLSMMKPIALPNFQVSRGVSDAGSTRRDRCRLPGPGGLRLQTLDPNTLRPSDVARLLEVASRVERMARGVRADEPSVQERGWTISAHDLRQKLKEGLVERVHERCLTRARCRDCREPSRFVALEHRERA